MKRFYIIQATVQRPAAGYAPMGERWTMQQVPTFLLDAYLHGLRNEVEAQSFAIKMLKALVGGVGERSLVTVSAMLADHFDLEVQK